MMHRALAMGYGTSMRSNVKKGTYSPIPLVINSSEVWDFYLKLYRDIVVAPGAVLTLASTLELPQNGTIIVNDGAALVIERNLILSDNQKIIVQNGGTLQLLPGGYYVEMGGNSYIEVQPGGYFCIEQGRVIKLNDVTNVIKLRPGYHVGVNTSLLPPGNCVSNPVAYPKTGNGKIISYEADIYIQNMTITDSLYINGKNVYVGRDVIPDSNPPRGDVILEPGSNVVFDAENDVIFEGGFEAKKGATFEAR